MLVMYSKLELIKIKIKREKPTGAKKTMGKYYPQQTNDAGKAGIHMQKTALRTCPRSLHAWPRLGSVLTRS